MKLLADYLETIKEVISIEVEPLLDDTADREELLDAIITALAIIYDTLDECVSHIEELKQEENNELD